jgi:hypothetical protein
MRSVGAFLVTYNIDVKQNDNDSQWHYCGGNPKFSCHSKNPDLSVLDIFSFRSIISVLRLMYQLDRRAGLSEHVSQRLLSSFTFMTCLGERLLCSYYPLECEICSD